MGLKDKKIAIEAIDNCIEYILENEAEDFAENPSVRHVYYHAYLAMHGPRKASDMLEYQIKDNEGPKNV